MPPLDLPVVASSIRRMVRILQINAQEPEAKVLQEAGNVLAQGGLVIVPTETVYGIACNPAVPGAMEKLIAAKGRDGDKPVARLAASVEQVRENARTWTSGLETLAKRYWPGPLTIVLETADGWIGYRVPNHAVPLGLARFCGRSLALTSANLSGEADTKTAQEAIASVEADLALDSGPSADAAIPSTVVKVAGETLECLREGVVPFSEIKTEFHKSLGEIKMVLFVCTGNTCRSPMAEALFRHRIGPETKWRAASAGVYAANGCPASDNAVEALRELDVGLEEHRSQPLTAELVEKANLIVTMTEAHRDHILGLFPEVEAKVYLINSFGTSKVPADISDPFGGSLNTYEKTRNEIDRALSDLILFIRDEQH